MNRALSGPTLLWILGLLLPLLLILGLAAGPVSIALPDIAALLLGSDSQTPQSAMIIQQIRAPRSCLAALVGAGLALSGAVMQGLFRNPLADPSLIGVSAGASAGASLAIVYGGSLFPGSSLGNLPLVAAAAFLGGALAVVLVYKLASTSNGTSVASMLLAGIAISALAGAVNSSLEFVSSSEMLRRISLWRMGGLDGASWAAVQMAFWVSMLCFARLFMHRRALNALLLGESEARHLGIPVQRLKTELILLVALIVGVSVALAGSIAFVGLVVPHIVRLLIGPDHRFLIPASALGGAILFLLADILARTLLAPSELPVGILTAALGAPFFISLLRNRRNYGFEY